MCTTVAQPAKLAAPSAILAFAACMSREECRVTLNAALSPARVLSSRTAEHLLRVCKQGYCDNPPASFVHLCSDPIHNIRNRIFLY